MVLELDPLSFGIAAAIVAVAGLIRGVTGFGGSMVMTPPLAVLLSPPNAVSIALILETLAALQFLPEVSGRVKWRTLAPIGVAAAATVPLGGYLLLSLDKEITRRLIAGVVILCSAALLIGFQHGGRHRMSTSIGLGLISGTMLGATGIGAPPVILYLLAGPDPIHVTRANLTIYVTWISLLGLATLSFAGVVTFAPTFSALLLLPLFLGGMWIGSSFFARMSGKAARQVTLVLLALLAGLVLAI